MDICRVKNHSYSPYYHALFSTPRRLSALRPTFRHSMWKRNAPWSPFRPAIRKPLLSKLAFSASMSVTAAGTAVLLVFFCLLFAEACKMTVSLKASPFGFYPRSMQNIFRPAQTLSPMERQLHTVHSVPLRYVHALPPEHQESLLSLLSRPTFDNGPETRKAVFTRISGCNPQQCLRALASSMAYSRATGRASVVFADSSGKSPLTDILRLERGGLLNNESIVFSLDQNWLEALFPEVERTSDWAEFGVTEAMVPANVISQHSSSKQVKKKALTPPVSWKPNQDEDALSQESPRVPLIANTKHVATLDNLAVTDTHISLLVSDVVWGKYAPRTSQEKILSEELQTASEYSQQLVHRAAILGRRKETRTAATAAEILHDTFKVPKMLLQGMTPFARRLFLLKLMSKRRKGVKNPRAIFVHAQYGLGNRLRALGSAMAFARKTERVLVLIWVPDQHLDCKYTDLFVPSDEFVVSDSFYDGEEWPFAKTAEGDSTMSNVKWYNFMRTNGVQANSPQEEIRPEKGRHIYASTCYVIQSSVTPFIIRTQSSYWQVLRSLTPHIDVLRLTERFASYPMSSMMGVHIRGRTIKVDISGISAADYSEESSRRTDYWRNLTQVDTFVKEMRRQPKDQLFYAAADEKSVLTRLEREFPSRVFFTPRQCDSRAKACLPYALADILLLARCSSLRGSYWSSFSELSVRIGGARFLLAGVDFGRPDS